MAEPIYIVSGFPRSGTSMMMRALEAGGIAAAFDRTRDLEEKIRPDGYHPNPNGFYELDNLHNVKDWSGFRRRIVKVVRCNICFMPVGENYRIVYMRRDKHEIRESYHRMTGDSNCDFLRGYDESVGQDLTKLALLGSVSLLDYAAVVANPAQELARLRWPLHVDSAAATIDRKLYRSRP
jgi:hypothetical protein